MGAFPTAFDPIEELYNTQAGAGNIYRRNIKRRLPTGASSLYRNYTERQQDPYRNLFEQQRGLGEIGIRGSLDAPAQNFDEFLDQQGLGAPPQSQIRSQLSRVNQLIGGGEEGLKNAPLAYRQSLIETPNSQFQMALDDTLASTPNELRFWLQQVAQDAFDKFMVANPTGTDTPGEGFLPAYVNRGFSFFD
jgi:hypothetical protein